MSILYLSAGHHLADPGAVANGFKEAQLTIELRNLIKSELDKLQLSAFVRIDQDNWTLNEYVSHLSQHVVSKDLIVDLHFNAANANATGVEVLVPFRANEIELFLANKASSLISQTLEIKNRGIKDETQSQHKKLAIMRPNANNILIEVCFITNNDDMHRYQQNKQILAKDLAHLFATFLN